MESPTIPPYRVVWSVTIPEASSARDAAEQAHQLLMTQPTAFEVYDYGEPRNPSLVEITPPEALPALTEQW